MALCTMNNVYWQTDILKLQSDFTHWCSDRYSLLKDKLRRLKADSFNSVFELKICSHNSEQKTVDHLWQRKTEVFSHYRTSSMYFPFSFHYLFHLFHKASFNVGTMMMVGPEREIRIEYTGKQPFKCMSHPYKTHFKTHVNTGTHVIRGCENILKYEVTI